MRPVHSIATVLSTAGRTNRWQRLIATFLAAAVVSLGLTGLQAAPAQAATYSNARCGNTSGRVLLTFDDWAYGDPYRATRIGAYLRSHNIRAAFFLINKYAQNYPASCPRCASRATGCSTTPTPTLTSPRCRTTG